MGVFSNFKAFGPFYEDRVEVEFTRGSVSSRLVLSACVIDEGLVDLDSGAVADSLEHAYSVRLPNCDWEYDDSPRRGDLVRLENGVEMKVTSVERDDGCYVLHAKTKGGAA